MLDNPGKIIGTIALASLVCLAVFGVMSFFFLPKNPSIVDSAVSAFKDILLVAGGVKAGLSIPKKQDAEPTPAKEEPVTL